MLWMLSLLVICIASSPSLWFVFTILWHPMMNISIVLIDRLVKHGSGMYSVAVVQTLY